MGTTTRYLQIREEDLIEMERILPLICDRMGELLDSRFRTYFRRCQTILSNVRWDYGPPLCVERVDGPDDQPS